MREKINSLCNGKYRVVFQIQKGNISGILQRASRCKVVGKVEKMAKNRKG